jgi:hypothetical protein
MFVKYALCCYFISSIVIILGKQSPFIMTYSKDALPIAQFRLLGINPQDPAQMPPSELLLLLQGKRTSALPCKPALPGLNGKINFRARLSLSSSTKGKASLQFHPCRPEPENNFGLSPLQIQELKAHPDKPVLVAEEDQLWNVYLDPQTNELIGLNIDTLQAPLTINGQTLTEEQEMRFKLGETISILNPNGRETVCRLDPFLYTGIIGRNLDTIEINLDGVNFSVPYKGRTLIDYDYLLSKELGGLILIEAALKQILIETDPDLVFELEPILTDAKEEILQYKANHAEKISSDEIASILSRQLAAAGIPFSASLEALLPVASPSPTQNLSDQHPGEDTERIHWIASTNSIDSSEQIELETAIGATIIGILSVEEREKLVLAFQKVQSSILDSKEALSPIQLQTKMLDLLNDQLGQRLGIYQKETQLKISPSNTTQKQQPNISQ